MDQLNLATFLLNLVDDYQVRDLVKAVGGIAIPSELREALIVLILFAILIYREFKHRQHIQSLLTETQLAKAAFEANHKQLEKKLQESEACLQTLMNNVPFNCWICDAEGKHSMQNAADIQQWGNLIGLRHEEANLSSEILLQFLENRRRVLNGEILRSEWQYPSGSEVQTFLSILAPIYNNQEIQGFLGVSIDITEQKQIEKALRRQEEQYRRIVETATEGIWVLDREHRTTFVNQQMAKMLGYSVDEMLGQSLFAFMDEAGQELALRNIERRRQGIQEQHDFKFRCHNGADLWAIVSATPLFDDEQNYIGTLGMVTDVTDRKCIEESLRHSEEQLQLALTASNMGIWDWDLLSGHITWSRGHEQLFGIAPGSFDGTYAAFEACVHPDDRAAIVQAVHHARELQQDFQHEFRVVWSDGSVHWIEGKGGFFYNAGGEAVRMLGAVADISDRKRAERALQQKENFLQLVLDTIPEQIFWKNKQSVYLGCNRLYAEAAGLKDINDIISKTDYDLWETVSADYFREEDHFILETGQPLLQAVEQKLKADGEQNWVRVNKVPIPDAEGNLIGLLGTVEDITERKQAEESLRSRNQELLTLHKISEISLRNQSSNIIFQGVVEEISAATGFPIVAIELYDQVRQVMVFEGRKGISAKDEILEVPVAQTLSGTVAQTGQAIVKHFMPNELKQCLTKQDLNQLEIKTFVCMPMIVNQDTVGVLSLAHPDIIQIDNDTLRWIESLANYLALITHRQQLEASLQQTNVALAIQVAERTSELTAANQSLQQQRDQWQALFEHALDGIIIADDKGRYTDANPAACQLFGVSREDLLRSSVTDFAGSEVDIVESWQQFLQRGQMLGEFCLHRFDGTTRETEFNAIANFIPGHHLSVLRDVTERKHAEAALRESEERFRRVFDNAPIGIAVARITDHQLLMVNQAFCQLLDYTEAELLTQSCISVSHPDDSEKDKPFVKQMIAREINSYQLEKRYIKKNQETLWANLTTTAVRDQNGDIVCLVGMVQDITERRQAELEIRKFVALADNSSEFIGMCDMEFMPFYVNAAGKRLLGLNYVGQSGEVSVSDFFFPEDQDFIINEFFPRVLCEGQAEVEVRFRHFQTGEALWMIYNVLCIRDENNQPIALATVSRNITERKQAEVALKEAHENLTHWLNDLEQRHQEITLLNEMSDLMQACLTIDEAYIVIAQFMPRLFSDCSGAVYTIGESKNVVEAVTTWGDTISSQLLFTPIDCFALRRGQPHYVEDTHTSLCCKHLQKPLPTSYFCVPMAAQGETSGVLYLSLPTQTLTHTKQQLATTVARQVALAIANLKLYTTLQNQSIRDPLTGLFNRRYLNEFLERELRRAERHQHCLSLLLLDVDHFKQFNDTFGHDAGDAVLRHLSQFLHQSVRNSDIACRYGGEEMVLILPNASPEGTMQRAEQLRQGVKRLTVDHPQSLGMITISIGVACFPQHGSSTEALLQAADLALYQAKAAGRDRVVMATTHKVLD